MTSKDIIANCILLAVIVLFAVGLFFNFRYIESLENQVYQRDSLIRELSFSDQLVREYFDVQFDTLTHSRSYTLKDNKKTKIIERQEHTVVIDGKKLNFRQFYDEYVQLVDKYNALVMDYNTLVEDVKKNRRSVLSMSRKVDSLQTLVQDKQYFLNSISRSYGIVCKATREGNTIHYSMKGSPQLDSALRIYPYFKDLATYDKDRDVWVISVPNKKRIDTIVEISYRKSSQ